jgi:tRNA pseudouridine55 synthase
VTTRPASATPDGFAVVDKPAGLTSHDVVDRVRRSLGTRKVGHAGTLDPDATGVLLVGVGKATRLLRYAGDLPKSYAGEVVLGTETTTLDSSGEVVARYGMAGVSLEHARAAAATFVGDILQVPPMVSALKVGGRRLHELAREGVEVEREARPVTVHRFDVTGWAEPGVLAVEVECSGGTYVRTLAADLGRALGGGAHLRNLRRTAIGPHMARTACPLDGLVLRPVGAAVAHLPHVEVDDEVAALVRTGRRLVRDGPVRFDGDGPWAVVCGGDLLAVYEAKGPQAVPGVVLPAG